MNVSPQPAPETQATFSIRRGTPADIAFIMATERGDGYAQFVGRWEDGEHRAAFVDPAFAYFLGLHGDEPVGFILVQHWRSDDRVTLVRRVAVKAPGQGYGRRLLAAVVSRIFDETEAHRVWLGLYPDNIRARRTYESVGFRPEGIARGSVFMNGEHRDQLIMAVLRTEWDAIRREGAKNLNVAR